MTTAARGFEIDPVAPAATVQGDPPAARSSQPIAGRAVAADRAVGTGRGGGGLMWFSLLIATIPVVAAVIRALVTGWMPVGDNAYFTVRSRDVLTQHHPLLGAWSSGSHAVEANVNNLGPLQLDMLAPFTKIAPVAGTAIGVGVVQLAAVIGIALTLRRLAGPVVVMLAMAVTTGIAWSLGSAMLVETRQHHYLVLPFLCFLVLVWAVSAGAIWALPWTAFVGSLLLQTHLTYGYLVAGLTLWALVGLGAHVRNVRVDPEQWSEHRRGLLRQGAITGGVVLVCWVQPIIDQFFGTGNIANALGASGTGDGLGTGTAVRLVATVVALPPWWARPSFVDFDPEGGLVSATSAAVGLAIVGALLFGAAWLSRRAGSRVGLMGVGTAAIAVLVAVVNTVSIPEGNVGFHAGNYRWLWPISAFVLLAILTGVLLGVRQTSTSRTTPGRIRMHLVPAVVVATTVVLAMLSIPAAYHAGDEENGARRMAVTARLIDQMDDLDVDGPLLYDRRDVFFGEPYTYPVLFKLQELGIEFTLHEHDVLRFGTERRQRGQASHTLKFVWGDAAREVPSDALRVAFVPGIDDEEQRELDELSDSIAAYLRSGRVEVNLTAFSSNVARWLELDDRRRFDTVGLLLLPAQT